MCKELLVFFLSLLSLLSFTCCRPSSPLRALFCYRNEFSVGEIEIPPSPLCSISFSIQQNIIMKRGRLSSFNIYNSALSQSWRKEGRIKNPSYVKCALKRPHLPGPMGLSWSCFATSIVSIFSDQCPVELKRLNSSVSPATHNLAARWQQWTELRPAWFLFRAQSLIRADP